MNNKIYVLYTRDNKRHSFNYKCDHIEYTPEERFVKFFCSTADGDDLELMAMYPTAFISYIKCIDKREDSEMAV